MPVISFWIFDLFSVTVKWVTQHLGLKVSTKVEGEEALYENINIYIKSANRVKQDVVFVALSGCCEDVFIGFVLFSCWVITQCFIDVVHTHNFLVIGVVSDVIEQITSVKEVCEEKWNSADFIKYVRYGAPKWIIIITILMLHEGTKWLLVVVTQKQKNIPL